MVTGVVRQEVWKPALHDSFDTVFPLNVAAVPHDFHWRPHESGVSLQHFFDVHFVGAGSKCGVDARYARLLSVFGRSA